MLILALVENMLKMQFKCMLTWLKVKTCLKFGHTCLKNGHACLKSGHACLKWAKAHRKSPWANEQGAPHEKRTFLARGSCVVHNYCFRPEKSGQICLECYLCSGKFRNSSSNASISGGNRGKDPYCWHALGLKILQFQSMVYIEIAWHQQSCTNFNLYKNE